MSRITDIVRTMKTWWNEDEDPFVHRALDEIIRIDQEQLPTIGSKHGKWIYQFRDSENEEYRCSACGFPQEFKSNFCPNCGSDNREREDE